MGAILGDSRLLFTNTRVPLINEKPSHHGRVVVSFNGDFFRPCRSSPTMIELGNRP